MGVDLLVRHRNVTPSKYLFQVDIFYRQAPLIEEGDYLGWSCTGSLPIWGVPGDTEAMYYRTDPLDSGPSPGQASGYQFQTLRPAYVFPAAVEIVTCMFIVAVAVCVRIWGDNSWEWLFVNHNICQNNHLNWRDNLAEFGIVINSRNNLAMINGIGNV